MEAFFFWKKGPAAYNKIENKFLHDHWCQSTWTWPGSSRINHLISGWVLLDTSCQSWVPVDSAVCDEVVAWVWVFLLDYSMKKSFEAAPNWKYF